MRRFITVAVASFLSLSLVAAANAAPAGKAAAAKKSHIGVQNSKKVQLAKLEREKKMRDIRKKGQAKRLQAQSGK